MKKQKKIFSTNRIWQSENEVGKIGKQLKFSISV